MASLGVNIDHIANIREARRTVEPDPVSMALLAELGGADGITVHLREDRRHIQDRDVELLRQTVRSRLNLEMAATEEMVAIALRMQMLTAFATTRTTASASTMSAAFAMAQALKATAVVTVLRQATAIATETNSTPSANAVETVTLMRMPMAFATTKTIVWARWTPVAFAMAQVPFSSADAATSLQVDAIATAHCLMRSECAVATVLPTPMPMAFVTTWTTAWT